MFLQLGIQRITQRNSGKSCWISEREKGALGGSKVNQKEGLALRGEREAEEKSFDLNKAGGGAL